MMKKYSLLVLPVLVSVLILSTTKVVAQCDPPAQLPTQNCQDAPLTCLQDACYSTQSWPPGGEPPMWCGPNTAVHNPQYFLFEAVSMNVQINIHVNSCVGGGCGLQAAIIDTCTGTVPPWAVEDVLDCDPGTSVGGTMVLTIQNAVPGQQYWLMIDGCSGQICEYTIDFVDGILSLDIPTELTSAGTDNPVVCQGWDEWTAWAQSLIPEAHGYLWTGFPWSPGYHTTTYPDFSGPNDPLAIPDNAPPGIYEICVVAFSGCDTSDIPQCFELEIVEIEDGIAPPVTLCPEEFVGITWHGMQINGPGIYTAPLETPEGCPFDSIKEYIAYPEPEVGQVDTVVCEQFFIYEGMEYNQAGTYDLFYDDASSYGCDSTAELHLDLIYLEVETDFFCEFGLFVLTSQVILAIPGTSGIQYEWYLDNSLVSEDASFSWTEPGSYELFVSYEINGVLCTFPATTNPLVISLEDLVPEAPDLDNYSNTACALDYPVYSVVVEDDILYYEWSASPSGVPLFTLGNMDSQVEVNWQGFTNGTICVHAVNHCGPGPDTCFDVTVIPSPVADFNMVPEACADSAVTIQFTGVASPDATFIWNFGGGTVEVGGTGPGPHVVSWGTPGYHTVSLQVSEEGCDTSDIEYEIFIENLGQPVVSCNSTLNTVTFEWSPVNGAGSYQVTVLQGPTGMLVGDTSYIVTGLDPGTTVEIMVTALGVGACPSTSVVAQCIAQSCPPVVIAIQIGQDTFCTGDVTGAIDLSATVNMNPATGTWSGPGVDPSGTFDPNDPSAGPGVHTIVFMYSEGTCNYQRSKDIIVIESPTADFTVDSVICQTDNATVLYTGNASVNAVYSWDFGTGVAAGSGGGPYIVTWSSPGMKTISLTVEENGCTSDVVTHTVDVQPVINPPSIQCFPTTSSVAIQWSMVPNATTYDVTHLFGPMGTINGNRYEVDGLMPGDSVSIEITVSGNTICPPVTVVASCVARNCPTPTIAVEPVPDICLYPGTGTVDLKATVTDSAGSGSWSGNGVIDVNQGIFDPNMAGAGSHMIDFNYLEDGCSFVESIVIQVYDPPSAVISNTNLTLTCENGNQLVLDGSSSSSTGSVSYSWSTPNGVILGAANQATATAGAEGEYFLEVTDLVSGCRDTVSVSLVQDAGVPDADAGEDGRIDCNIEFVVLGGMSSTGPGITYLWSSSDGGTIASDPTGQYITVTNAGTYDLTVTDTNNGCSAVDQATVTMDIQQPTGTLTAGEVLDCDTESTTVTADITPVGSGYTYSWSTQDGRIIGGAGTSQITVDLAGTYTLIVTSLDNGCKDTISVPVLADPEVIQALDTRVDNPSCVGDNDGMIEIIEVIGGTPPYTYAWSNQSSGSGLLFLAPGNYSVTVTDANGCRFTETYSLPAPQPINPDLGPDIRVNENEKVTLTLTVNDPGSVKDITWTGPVPPCPGCFENSFDALVGGTVVVTVVDTNDCVDSVRLRLTVYRPRNVFVPSVFSPNGDNINDVFRIVGNTIVEVRDMQIFDRWGNVVFTQMSAFPGSDEGWDGTYRGKQVPAGVYVFKALLIHDDEFEEYISGDVTVVR